MSTAAAITTAAGRAPESLSSTSVQIQELIALVKARADAAATQSSASRAAMIALGEVLHKLRQSPGVDRLAYGRLVAPWVNIKRAGRAVRMYLESIGAAPKTERSTEQNPASRATGGHDGSGVPNENPACQPAAQPLSQDEMDDLLGCTPVPPSVVADEPEGGEGGAFEDEFEGEDEFEISNLKFESGEAEAAVAASRATETAETADAGANLTFQISNVKAQKDHGLEARATPSIGPQLTLASLYEQAQTVGTEFMRVIESGLDEAVKARLVADVRGLVAAAMKTGPGSENRATTEPATTGGV